MTTDEEHLRLLAIFHYVVAAVTALFSLFPILHLVMGLAIVSGAFDNASGGDEFPTVFGWFFVVMAGTLIICGLTLATLIAVAGRSLQLRQRRVFCLVVAGLSCMIMPFGTVLGVFTIVVLMRDSVRSMFEPASAPAT